MTRIPPIPPISKSIPVKENTRELLEKAGIGGMCDMAAKKNREYEPAYTVNSPANWDVKEVDKR